MHALDEEEKKSQHATKRQFKLTASGQLASPGLKKATLQPHDKLLKQKLKEKRQEQLR